jgi:hypothetical protein
MPGREELIQQNIARARAKSQTPQEQENAGQTGSASSGGSAPRSFLGGNRDVYESLIKIEFQGIPGDGSMRGNTAYIRVWERAEVAEKTSNKASAPSFYDDKWAELTNNLWNTETPLQFSSEAGKNLTTYFDPDQFKNISVPEFQVFPSGTFSFNEQLASAQRATQENLSGTIPTTDPVESSQKTTSATTPPSSTSRTPFTSSLSDTMGSVQSANPGDQTTGGNNSTSGTGKMMWQFLFNPSELELETGPEFKNAETWGVSDKANSGQPLHWSHNKNTLLKFNSVLLNGFVFGRKVESLEQGIIELFMSRDGDGQHGPHVLEFVWGKRVFGPCVIKNINIKEKMWDEGEVVNAELSFTLEQVPEWTINDGFVDVARPGRLATEGDSTKPGSSASNPAGNTDPNGGNSNPGGGQSPDQKSKTPQTQEDFVGCKNLQQLQLNAKAFNPIPGTYYSAPSAFSFGGFSGDRVYRSNFDTNYARYNDFVRKGNNIGVTVSGKCVTGTIKKAYQDAAFYQGKPRDNSTVERADKNAASTMNSCAEELGKKAGNFYVQKGCRRFQANRNSSTERI